MPVEAVADSLQSNAMGKTMIAMAALMKASSTNAEPVGLCLPKSVMVEIMIVMDRLMRADAVR